MTIKIPLNSNHIQNLDLSPLETIIRDYQQRDAIAELEQTLQLAIDYPRSEGDMRELSEIPEVRLWFLRLDAVYPWIIFILDPKNGEIARYAAMLVPHQFQRTEGIQYNPEALEIFVMQKLFILADWLKNQQISPLSRLKFFAQQFGYDIDEEFLSGL
jgi:hypothetical protein